MTYLEMKRKIMSLIEEIDDIEKGTTNDLDIKTKLPYVINQIQNELSRMKKIPAYVEIEVLDTDELRFSDLKKETKDEIYQLDYIRGAKHELKAQGTVIKCLETGTLEIEYFKYPQVIDENTPDDYVFSLSNDVLEIMPYGVAADLLKNDTSNAYGNIYANRYEQMKRELDPRYSVGLMEVEGGVDV